IRQLGRVFLLLLLAAPFVTSEPGTWSQEPIPTPPATTTAAAAQRPTSTPYTGDLSIFDTPDRDKKLQIERVMDILNIHAGSTVADIGAGSGWFTVRAANRVGVAPQDLPRDRRSGSPSRKPAQIATSRCAGRHHRSQRQRRRSWCR